MRRTDIRNISQYIGIVSVSISFYGLLLVIIGIGSLIISDIPDPPLHPLIIALNLIVCGFLYFTSGILYILRKMKKLKNVLVITYPLIIFSFILNEVLYNRLWVLWLSSLFFLIIPTIIFVYCIRK